MIFVLATSTVLLTGCSGKGRDKVEKKVEREYVWSTDSSQVTWTPGAPHPQRPDVIAADRKGYWLPAPGYAWDGDPGRLVAKWSPGMYHPRDPNIRASEVEKKWVPAPGFAWEGNNPRTFRVVPDAQAKAPMSDQFDQRLVGTWNLRIQSGFADVSVVTYLYIKFEADGKFMESSSSFANGNNLTWVNAGPDEKGRVSRSGNVLTFAYESGRRRSTNYQVAQGGARFGGGEWYLKE